MISRHISLAFIGDKYKDSYLEFTAIAAKEYETLQDKFEGAQKNPKQTIPLILEELQNRFVSGKVDGKDFTKEELDELPLDVLLECLAQLRGKIDPKG